MYYLLVDLCYIQ